MSAVVLKQKEHSLLEITRTLLSENAKGQRAKYDALADYGLDDFYWRGVASIYGYESAAPSIDDFVLWIFRKAIEGFKSDRPGGLQNIQLDFASFRNDRRSSGRPLDSREARVCGPQLRGDASRTRASATLSRSTCSRRPTRRSSATWHARSPSRPSRRARSPRSCAPARAACGSTATGSSTRRSAAPRSCCRAGLARLHDGVVRRGAGALPAATGSASTSSTASSSSPTAPTKVPEARSDALREQVEKRYTNKFVYELGNAWQQQVDQADKWRSTALRPQTVVLLALRRAAGPRGDKKAVVIISDAMRYEVADELGSRIRQEDRFDADLDAVLGVLPSYTQLGMAALLPHSTLKHSPDGKTVLADGQPTNGTGPARRSLRASVGRRSRPRTSRP